MDFLFEPPWKWVWAGGLTLLAVHFQVRSIRFFRLGLGDPDHPDYSLRVVRGFRSGIIAIGFAFATGGVLTRTVWPLLFALVFLGEELVETGIMIWALRRQKKAEGGQEGSRP